MSTVAKRLGNTPAICRKSYVPETLVAAFESRRLQRKAGQRRISSERLLAALIAKAPAIRRAQPDLRKQLERSARRVSAPVG
jgi:DNA topoisomerase IB